MDDADLDQCQVQSKALTDLGESIDEHLDHAGKEGGSASIMWHVEELLLCWLCMSC